MDRCQQSRRSTHSILGSSWGSTRSITWRRCSSWRVEDSSNDRSFKQNFRCWLQSPSRSFTLSHSMDTELIHHSVVQLIRYFTCGPQEVRAWTIRDGTKAPQAAGVIQYVSIQFDEPSAAADNASQRWLWEELYLWRNYVVRWFTRARKRSSCSSCEYSWLPRGARNWLYSHRLVNLCKKESHTKVSFSFLWISSYADASILSHWWRYLLLEAQRLNYRN